MATNSRTTISGTRQLKPNCRNGRAFGQDITNKGFALSKSKTMENSLRNKNSRGHAKMVVHRRSKPLVKQQVKVHHSLQAPHPVGNLKKYIGNNGTASTVRIKKVADDIDLRDTADPSCATEYVEDMYAHFLQMEKTTGDYMEAQPDISKRLRLIVVDWLMEVHNKGRLGPESLYLAVNIFDRYLSNQKISRYDLQLVGLTSLFIACKYEEIYHPSINEFIAIGDAPFRREQVLEMQIEVLKSLNYQISAPTACTFLPRFTKAAHADETIVHTVSYLVEGALLSYDLLRKYKPSELVAASIYLARHHSPRRTSWSATLEKYTGYNSEEVALVARSILLAKRNRSVLKSKNYVGTSNVYINKKYSGHDFGGVARIYFQLD